MGVVIMQGVPKIFGALRGHLCDSIAFLYLNTLSRLLTLVQMVLNFALWIVEKFY